MNIGKASEQIIKKSPFLLEALNEGLINVSSLARKIRPEVEQLIGKEVNESAIVVAIKRLPPSKLSKVENQIYNVIQDIGEVVLRSKLVVCTYQNSVELLKGQSAFINAVSDEKDLFYSVSRNTLETTIITNEKLLPLIEKYLGHLHLISFINAISAITINLPQSNADTPGTYYFILKTLALEGINILEMISTTNEFTIVIKNEEVDHAIGLLMKIVNQN